MPHDARLIRISTVLFATFSLALTSACSSSSDSGTAPHATHPSSVSAGIAKSTPTAKPSAPAARNGLPEDLVKVARSFTAAFVQHDARDGHDRAFADAGARAAAYASGELVGVLPQRRPGQDAPWTALREERAKVTARIVSVRVPDGAPAAAPDAALVRVAYTLTTTPTSGPARRSDEQLALRLEHTSDGWRVTALPWA
ncbi:hypothetical protein ACFU99_05300 [Streptomyces sp. NPDC057654]|uniref:hypothetical protein n=1 Tax=Streptomyces sp. NPDC057654 TaxID=3346196 RepID=UPI0036C08CA7